MIIAIQLIEYLVQRNATPTTILDYLRLTNLFGTSDFSLNQMVDGLAISTPQAARFRALQLVRSGLAKRTHTTLPKGGRAFVYQLLPVPYA